jgi:putative Mg2+ transporter-C (MgtC) family protein
MPDRCLEGAREIASTETGDHLMTQEAMDILLRLFAAGLIGAVIGYERRMHHKAIGVAGMVLIAIGSVTYMLLALHLAELDSSSISRTLQGFLSGIGFLGGAVVFKSGFDVKGIKAAAAVWITGATGLAVATSYWWLGIIVGVVTAAVMFAADSFPDPVREAKQEPLGERED